jgi:hypothetical protein
MSEDALRATDRLERQLHSAVREELVQLLAELEDLRRREPAPAEVEQFLGTLREILTTTSPSGQ